MAAFSNQLPEGQLSRAVIESLLKLQHPLSDHMVQATLVALVEKACMRAAEQSAAGNVIYRRSGSRKGAVGIPLKPPTRRRFVRAHSRVQLSAAENSAARRGAARHAPL